MNLFFISCEDYSEAECVCAIWRLMRLHLNSIVLSLNLDPFPEVGCPTMCSSAILLRLCRLWLGLQGVSVGVML